MPTLSHEVAHALCTVVMAGASASEHFRTAVAHLETDERPVNLQVGEHLPWFADQIELACYRLCHEHIPPEEVEPVCEEVVEAGRRLRSLLDDHPNYRSEALERMPDFLQRFPTYIRCNNPPGGTDA